MAFAKVGTLVDNVGPVMLKQIITNSEATTTLYSMKLASGFATAGTAGALVYGHIMSHVDKNGVGVITTGVAGAALGSYAGSWTAASDNQTVGKVAAIMDVSKNTLYSCSFETAIGTTTGSNLPGYFCDLDSATDLDESDTATTTFQYALHGVDPKNSAKAIGNIYESQVFGV